MVNAVAAMGAALAVLVGIHLRVVAWLPEGLVLPVFAAGMALLVPSTVVALLIFASAWGRRPQCSAA